jgi:hypothetical protein
MTDARTLPGQYVKNGSDAAFRELAAIKKFEGLSYAGVAAMLQNETQRIPVLRLDRMRDVTDIKASFVLSTQQSDNGETQTRDEAVLQFQKLGNEWKATGVF